MSGALCARIEQLLGSQERVVIAIDGGCGSGKSTFAEELRREYEAYGCVIIAMDDFFLQTHQRTPARLSQAGGNIDYERFIEEVLLPLKAGWAFSYRRYDCKTRSFGTAVTVDVKQCRLVIIEGVYSLHPAFVEFDDLYDIRVFVDADATVRLQRLTERAPHVVGRFVNEWVPMEELYFETFKIADKCEFRIEG